MSTETLDVLAVGKQLAEFCNQGKNLEAVDALYSDSITSVEAMDSGNPNMPQTMTGIDAIRAKNQWWCDNHEVHTGKATGPFPHGNKFILFFDYDVTAKCGPMNGQRMQMQEAGLYTVDNGKIIKEEYFYHMGG
jgi:hypothetical protein